eukprot:12990155-Alexandrium_andersonii.AAC.1
MDASAAGSKPDESQRPLMSHAPSTMPLAAARRRWRAWKVARVSSPWMSAFQSPATTHSQPGLAATWAASSAGIDESPAPSRR